MTALYQTHTILVLYSFYDNLIDNLDLSHARRRDHIIAIKHCAFYTPFVTYLKDPVRIPTLATPHLSTNPLLLERLISIHSGA